MIRSLIKEDETLRKAIKARLKELKWTQERLAEECATLGRPEIRRQSISRYISKNIVPGVLNDDQIIYIATLLDIPVQLVVGNSKNPVLYKIPKYNKERALDNIKKYDTQREDSSRTGADV